MKGYEAVEKYMGMTEAEFAKHDREEIECEDGILFLDFNRRRGVKVVRFFTFAELNIIKQAWRENVNWRPVDSLIKLIDFTKPYDISAGEFEFI